MQTGRRRSYIQMWIYCFMYTVHVLLTHYLMNKWVLDSYHQMYLYSLLFDILITWWTISVVQLPSMYIYWSIVWCTLYIFMTLSLFDEQNSHGQLYSNMFLLIYCLMYALYLIAYSIFDEEMSAVELLAYCLIYALHFMTYHYVMNNFKWVLDSYFHKCLYWFIIGYKLCIWSHTHYLTKKWVL